MFFKAFLKYALLPPGVFVLLILAGLIFLVLRKPLIGRGLVAGGTALFIAFSVPVVSDSLMTLAQGTAKPIGQVTDEQAIVILSAGIQKAAPEYGDGPIVDRVTLERLRYGASLHRKSLLPVLVTGGLPPELSRTRFSDLSVADLMAETLNEEFHVPAAWVEPRAKNTWDNGRYAADILQPAGIRRVILVTHAWHMDRAVKSFETVGFQVTPAPTGFHRPNFGRAENYIPSGKALHNAYFAFHELVGRAYYGVRFWRGAPTRFAEGTGTDDLGTLTE
ncbi:MAG: YdcF family protein [Pseudomonadota bacterium]